MKTRPVNLRQTLDLIEKKLGREAIAGINAWEKRILSK